MIGLNYLGKMGQLGNQMFQYAALKGIASKSWFGFYNSKSYGSNTRWSWQHTYGLNCLNHSI